jgi:MFS family permease
VECYEAFLPANSMQLLKQICFHMKNMYTAFLILFCDKIAESCACCSLQIPSFFSTILLGGYSDLAGRKAAIISPLVGAAFRLLIFIFTVAFDLHPVFLIVSSVVDGIGGGTSTILMACSAYISDVSDNRTRSTRVVILEVSSGIALVTSVLGLGYALANLGFMWTFVILMGVLLLAMVYVVFVLPETVNHLPESGAVQLFKVEHFTRLLKLFINSGEDHMTKHKWELRFALIVVFLVSAIQTGRTDVMTLFMLAPPLCFTSVWIGYFYAIAFFVMNLSMLIFTHPVVKRIGDLWPIVIGSLSGAGYMLMFGLATNSTELFLCK